MTAACILVPPCAASSENLLGVFGASNNSFWLSTIFSFHRILVQDGWLMGGYKGEKILARFWIVIRGLMGAGRERWSRAAYFI